MIRSRGREIPSFFRSAAYRDTFLTILIFSGKMDRSAVERELAQLGQQLEREMQLLDQLGQAPRDVYARPEFGGWESVEAQGAFIDCCIRVTRLNRRMRELHRQLVHSRL
ncbi:unnamed protein product [Cuscuta campestris]|uniref:Uncharacterized protein n=1 Tax=Cuscuta campestris TaxID=132261 RepID=A0A484N9Y2_9ASTE|nr:unnamed protein product [Cuscuta campestris]